MRRKKIYYILTFVFLTSIVSCTEYETSSITGWDFNNPKNGGFKKFPTQNRETGPGLVLIEGGTFTMGRIEQDVTYENHNVPRRVTVSSFYLDQNRNIKFSLV